MTAYALAYMTPQPPLHDDVFVYMERIQETMDPFGGRFIVHASETEVLEGPFEGAYVIIEFPDMDKARDWYASGAYQKILAMRADNIPGTTVLLQGVPPNYDVAATGRALRAAQAG
ncbi:DUF1330 domain-containing protein [Actinomadura luteofluorescens]|uniref:DUF1330 domain-containing protein n=1 Tax=Actinomadura luteofluorescens TaxID=46163 RepID=UPI002164C07F|nr:DUF1330 domain-containing protein [Actinomadura glauciflava]MCR3744508.1 Uncharacterized conserved protein, DUF1330 family [Actinomadura glauciflava]